MQNCLNLIMCNPLKQRSVPWCTARCGSGPSNLCIWSSAGWVSFKFVWARKICLKNSETFCHIVPPRRAGSADPVSQVCLMTHPLNQAWYWCGDVKPVKRRFYRVNADKRRYLDMEVNYTLENGISEPCISSCSSPCLLVPKSFHTFLLWFS